MACWPGGRGEAQGERDRGRAKLTSVPLGAPQGRIVLAAGLRQIAGAGLRALSARTHDGGQREGLSKIGRHILVLLAVGQGLCGEKHARTRT